MQVEAIYSQGTIQLVQPLRFKRDHIRLVVTVPDEDIEPETPASPTRRAIDSILGAWKHPLQTSKPTTLEDMAQLQADALEEKHLGLR